MQLRLYERGHTKGILCHTNIAGRLSGLVPRLTRICEGQSGCVSAISCIFTTCTPWCKQNGCMTVLQGHDALVYVGSTAGNTMKVYIQGERCLFSDHDFVQRHRIVIKRALTIASFQMEMQLQEIAFMQTD